MLLEEVTWQRRREFRDISYRKNDFAEGSKILLDIDLKMILLDHQNNFIGT